MRIPRRLLVGLSLLLGAGVAWAGKIDQAAKQEAPDATSRSDDQAAPAQSQARAGETGFAERAKQLLEEARTRLEQQRREAAAQEEQRRREAAERDARRQQEAADREAARQRAAAEREAQRRGADAERQHQIAERDEQRRRLEAEHKREQLRLEAQQLAIQLGREKLRQQVERSREAQRQLQVARERQLKALYSKGLAEYNRGNYTAAVELFQQVALIDPTHPLVKTAQQFIAQADLKRFEQRLRASAEAPETHGAIMPDLEQQLVQKRIEHETEIKYAKNALADRKYELAAKLLTAVLVQNPGNREAQQLLEQVKLAELDDAKARTTRQIERDEKAMINDVLKAQVLPPLPPLHRGSATLQQGAPGVSAKLREPVSFEFNDVALIDVLDFLSDTANVSIIPSPQLDLKTRRVTLKVDQLPLEHAIKYLAKSLSLAYRVEQDAILIATPEEFSNEPMETRVFFLHNGLGPIALETSAVEPNPALTMESITKLIQDSTPQPPDSKFIVDERSGAVIVTNTADNLASIERLLSQLDITPIQVLIEARFIELTATDLEHLGLETVLNNPVDLTKQVTPENSHGPGHQIAKGAGFKFPAMARESEGLNLTLEGVLTGVQFESVLHLLKESKQTKTLSAPRVTTLNNQTALIRVVEEFNYPTRYEVSLVQFDINGDGDFDDAGETEFANVPQDLQKRDIGILLNVTPSVGRDMKTITLVLAPEVSAFSQFRDLGGGVSVPEFTLSKLTTSAVMQDGETVMLGGLMKDTTAKTVTKLPVLGDLPLLGPLFRQTENSSTRKNLLIFITARLLMPRGPTT